MTQHRLLPLTALKPWPRNPRRIRPERLEQLKRSLAADPAMMDARPLVALPDGTVIMGNQRLAAAKALGWKRIQTLTVDLDDATAQSWALRDNQGYGEWDADAVGLMLAEMRAAGADLDLAGFEARETQRLLDAITLVPPGVDDAPALPKGKPRSKPGEVYELGEHRLLCGDSSNPEQVEILMDGASATLVLADPPYNVDYRGGTNSHNGTVKREREDAYADTFDDYSGWLARILSNAHAASDHKAALLLWHSPSQHRAIHAALDAARWVDRSLIVWNKGSIQGGLGQVSKQYRTQFEPMLHCHKKGRIPRWYGPGNETDVWDVPGPRANPLHPTMKPVALYERSLRNHSRSGELVLEMFGGSGTSLVASEILGRRARLIEIDPAYCDVIRARYEALA